jgi:hypothetical protein
MNEKTSFQSYDLFIEREGTTITKITKNGVVIWPTERHTAHMQQDKQIDEFRANELAEANARMAGIRQYLSRANQTMVGGYHYKLKDSTGQCPHCQGPIEHWDWAHNLRGLEYAATKYLARWRSKGGLDSLKKVIHYVQKLIEIHFPSVVVSISYSNRAGEAFAEGGGKRDTLQSAIGEYQKERAEYNRVREAEKSEGVAKRPSPHQTAMDQPLESPDYTADRFPQEGRSNY